MKCFTYVDQNHTYSYLLHLSHRGMVQHSNMSTDKIFPRKLFFFYCMFIGPKPVLSLYIPLNLGINLAKIDLVSARHLRKYHRFWKHVVKILEIPLKCGGDYMYFYTPTRSVKLRIDVSYTVITKISFGKGT